MRMLYRLVNGACILFSTLLCAFCSNATIGSHESLKQAAEGYPYRIFFLRTIVVLLALLAYTGLVFGLNRTVFREVADPARLFWASVGLYLLLTAWFVYSFIQGSLKVHTPA